MEHAPQHVSDTICRSCGDTHQQRFCPQCGEKRFDPASLRISHFFEEALEGLFHFDNKFLRSVKTLFSRPGQLGLDRVEGRTVRNVRPFQLFLIVNLIIFVLPFVNPFSLPLYNYITYPPFIHYHTVEAVNARIAADGTTMAAFEKVFDHSMHGVSKSLLVLFIPMNAFFFGLCFVNLRRRLLEHVVFATYYLTFVLLAFLLIMVFYLALGDVLGRMGVAEPAWFDNLLSTILSVSFIRWLYLAIRRFYRPHLAQAIGVAVLVGGSFFYLLQVYRMLLFHVVMHYAI
ncbi:MAG: DUF3667 domain-containing protein [Flavobacteriales bacterium]